MWRIRDARRWWLYRADPAPVAALLAVWQGAYGAWLLPPHARPAFDSPSYAALAQLATARGWGWVGVALACASLATMAGAAWTLSARGARVWGAVRTGVWALATLYWGAIAWTMITSHPSSTGVPAYSLAVLWSLWVWWRWSLAPPPSTS